VNASYADSIAYGGGFFFYEFRVGTGCGSADGRHFVNEHGALVHVHLADLFFQGHFRKQILYTFFDGVIPIVVNRRFELGVHSIYLVVILFR
jgi:hypothetical protein